MANKVRNSLMAAVAISALLNPDIQFALARGGAGGGGGHFVGSAAHFSGGHGGVRGVSGTHFGAPRISHAHFGSAHVRRLSRSHLGASRIGSSHTGKANARNFSGTRLGTSRTGAARVGTPHALATGATGAFAGKAAWNHWGNPNWQAGWNGGWNGGWGGWYGGWGGWAGPVFWPYLLGNLLAFAFWPYPYFDPFWAYGDWFVWDALFWPGPYYGPAYVYGPDYYDVYGGYAYGGPTRMRVARHAAPEITGSTPNQTDLAQSCGGLAPGVTDLPLDRIESTLQLTGEQLKALDDLKAATSQASDILKTSCSSEVPQSPVDRLDAVQKRIDGMMQALTIVRAPLDNFYNLLNEEQRQRFAALGSARVQRISPRGSAPGNDLASLCSRRAEGFTQLPVQRIEQVIKPAQQQLDAFHELKAASTQATDQLHASCPTQLPQTPLDRFDAVSKRLDAMSKAIKTVRPALADFYASLRDEQKARFNTLGPPTARRQG